MADFTGTKLAGLGEIEVGGEMLMYFAQSGQSAATNIKSAIDEAREDARRQQLAKEKNAKIARDLENLLAKLSGGSEPGNIAEIQKLLRDVAANPKLSDEQRQSAKDLIEKLNVPRPGDLLHNSLPSDKWQQFVALTKKYKADIGVSGNSRASILAWMNNNTGEKQGKKFIGTAKDAPAASAQDLQVLNDLRAYLNQRQTVATPIEWNTVNAELRSLFTAHADTQKDSYVGNDESVRMVQLQLSLQNYNSSINGASTSAKSLHDTKKAITDRM